MIKDAFCVVKKQCPIARLPKTAIIVCKRFFKLKKLPVNAPTCWLGLVNNEVFKIEGILNKILSYNRVFEMNKLWNNAAKIHHIC